MAIKTKKRRMNRRKTRRVRGGATNCPTNLPNIECNLYKKVDCPTGMPARLCDKYKRRRALPRVSKNLKLNIEIAAHNREKRRMSEEEYVAQARAKFAQPKPKNVSGIPEELGDYHVDDIHEYDPEANLGANTVQWD